MTKNFCDICGSRAHELKRSPYEHKFGESYHGFYDGAERVRQCRITVRISFGFAEHRSGFGGPPDLCKACAEKLASEAVKLL